MKTKTPIIIAAGIIWLILHSLFLGGCSTVHQVVRNPYIKVDISDQKLELYHNNRIVKEYSVSTSKYGIGFKKNSKKTPLGNFEIVDKIGAGLPITTNFYRRRPSKRSTGIISRIIRLNGLDCDNRNTESRGIYIHGTNHGVGIPKSIGCIGLTPFNVADLFNEVNIGTKVEIVR